MSDWRESALCSQVDVGDLFFPDDGCYGRAAKQVCKKCPVTPQCLQWAIDNGEQYGVWGGLTAAERYRLRKKRGRTPQCAWCGIPFPYVQNVKFCSQPCRDASDRQRKRAS